MNVKKHLCRWILHNKGWSIGQAGEDVEKCVICVAPHTSNTDFWIGKLFYGALGKKAKFLIKKEWFFFPLNILFGAVGGIPIDRKKSSSVTQQMADEFARRKYLHLAITPEGTRRKTESWKTGFYYIALKANVPILVACIDYGKKEVGIMATFYPTGNADDDIRKIQEMYKGKKGLHEDRF